MAEPVRSKKAEVSVGAAIPECAAPLESILCTDELRRRPSRPPDYERENRALLALRQHLGDSPETILQKRVIQPDTATATKLAKAFRNLSHPGRAHA